jgi:hypothetical protein
MAPIIYEGHQGPDLGNDPDGDLQGYDGRTDDEPPPPKIYDPMAYFKTAEKFLERADQHDDARFAQVGVGYAVLALVEAVDRVRESISELRGI